MRTVRIIRNVQSAGRGRCPARPWRCYCRFSLRQSGGQMHRNIRLALVVAAAALGGVSAAGQSGAWTPPRTPDGQPNLQGVWTNATITPLERPANLRDKAFLTEAEAAALERQAASAREEDGPPRAGDVGSYNQFWFDSGERVVSTRRTSLVVDTTNYNNKGWIATSAAAGRIKGVPQTESLHVVERFTPIDANTITYEATIDDPAMFTRPWTVSIPLHRDRAYTIYEYACHEGNRAVEGVLRGARAGETGK